MLRLADLRLDEDIVMGRVILPIQDNFVKRVTFLEDKVIAHTDTIIGNLLGKKIETVYSEPVTSVRKALEIIEEQLNEIVYGKRGVRK
jgi:ABC-type microcin C transport system duplicated ATPase subunit YejF